MTIPVIQHQVEQPNGAEYYSLGKCERPDAWSFRLRTANYCLIDMDEAGRIQTLRWQLPKDGLQYGLLYSLEEPDNFPLLLLRQKAEPLLVKTQSSLLAGTKGIAVKTTDGEVVWIPSEQILGFAFQLTNDSATDLTLPTDHDPITNDVTK